MNTKLTLTIEKSVIEKAKKYAQKSGRSLSDLVESYLARLISTSEELEEEVPEEFRNLFGSVTLPDNMDDKSAIRSIVRDKYRS